MVSLLNFQNPDQIKAMARRDRAFFELVYTEIERLNDLEVASRLEEITNPKIKQITGDLLRDGIACWRGMYADPDFLDSARHYCRDVLDHGNTLLRQLGREIHEDHERGLLYSAPGRCSDPDYTDLPLQGRMRALWNHERQDAGHETVRAAAVDPRLWAIISTASGRPPADRFIIAESLKASVDGQEWHIDKWTDQYKAMILLTDCDMHTGPLRFKAGSNRFDRPEKWKLMHDYYSLGPAYCNISHDVVREMPGDIVYATGKAGDCFFFDSCAIHAGTRVLAGERLNFVVYPVANSLKAQLIKQYLAD